MWRRLTTCNTKCETELLDKGHTKTDNSVDTDTLSNVYLYRVRDSQQRVFIQTQRLLTTCFILTQRLSITCGYTDTETVNNVIYTDTETVNNVFYTNTETVNSV